MLDFRLPVRRTLMLPIIRHLPVAARSQARFIEFQGIASGIVADHILSKRAPSAWPADRFRTPEFAFLFCRSPALGIPATIGLVPRPQRFVNIGIHPAAAFGTAGDAD